MHHLVFTNRLTSKGLMLYFFYTALQFHLLIPSQAKCFHGLLSVTLIILLKKVSVLLKMMYIIDVNRISSLLYQPCHLSLLKIILYSP